MSRCSTRFCVSRQQAFLMLSLTLAGCGGTDVTAPKVYKVTGRVLKPNKEPMPGGSVEFRHLDSTTFTTLGRIQEDGSFELFTMHNGENLPGALPGPHRVTITPSLQPGLDQKQAVAELIVLPTPYVVKPDDGNNFTIPLKPTKTQR